MQRVLAKLEQMLQQLQQTPGTNSRMLETVLQRLGDVQAAIDYFNSGTVDPQAYGKLQAQVATLNMGSLSAANIKAGVRQLNAAIGTTLNADAVYGLYERLADIQSQMVSSKAEAEAEAVSETMRGLRKVYEEAESMLLAQLEQLDLNNRTFLTLLQKMGSR